MRAQVTFTRGAATALVALAVLLAGVQPADAECIYKKSIVQVHKTDTVRATFKGTFEPGDVEFVPGGEILIQIGVAQQVLPVDAFKVNPKRQKYKYKGSWDQVVKKAVFDVKKGKVLIKCRSTEVSDYRRPMHAGLGSTTFLAFEVPVNPDKRKTKIKTPIVGQLGGAPLAAGALGPGGGDVVAPGVIVTAGPGAFRDDVNIDVNTAVMPAGLPAGVLPAGAPVDVDVGNGGGALEEPLQLQFGYDGTNAGPDDVVTVLHYDEETGQYDPTTVTDVDAGTVTVQCRSFSIFVPVILLAAAVPDSYAVPGFAPGTHGWSIPNFGSYFSPGGNCLGMSAYCSWFFGARSGETLSTKYTGESARIMATRAHLAQSQYWALQQFDFQQALGETLTARIIRAYLAIFGDPAVFVMLAPNAGHATVCYGYDQTGFNFYDVNVVGQTQTVSYSLGGGFGTYGAYDRFAVVALPTLGRYSDFDTLYQDAENGFRSGDVTITAPVEGITLTTRSTNVTGTVADPAWDGVSVFVNGQRYDSTISGGAFSMTVPLVNGENPITVLAGTGINTQSSFAPGSGVAHVDIDAELPETDLLVALRWLQNDTDVDLYLYEPDGEVCWYSNLTTSSGTMLDIDDVNGYGPEHITVGTVEAGLYRVRVHYYSDHGNGVAATGTVDVILFEGTPAQQHLSFPINIGVSNNGNSAPSGTGPDWVDIADVDILGGVIIPK